MASDTPTTHTSGTTNRPRLDVMKRSILNFARGLVSPTILRAMEILLSPCCDLNLSVAITCNPDNIGRYDLTIKLGRQVNLLNKGLAVVIIGGIVVTPPLLHFTDGDTITLTNVEATVGSHTVSVLLTLPVTAGTVIPTVEGISLANPGVIISGALPNVVFPNCK